MDARTTADHSLTGASTTAASETAIAIETIAAASTDVVETAISTGMASAGDDGNDFLLCSAELRSGWTGQRPVPTQNTGAAYAAPIRWRVFLLKLTWSRLDLRPDCVCNIL